MRTRHITGSLLVLLLLSCSMGTQEIRRPATDADDATAGACDGDGNRLTSSAMANFHDAGGDGTSSTIEGASSPTTDRSLWRQRKFTAWAAASGSYSALDLKVRTAFDSLPDVPVGGEHGKAVVQYSTDGGTTWTVIRSAAADWAATTDSVSLSVGQSLALLQVRVCAVGIPDSGEAGSGTLTGYDIRTEGTLSGAGVGPRRHAIITEVLRPREEVQR